MKQTIQIGTLSALNIGIAFLFQWYVLTQLGPGIETDALFAGMTLPQLVLAVISGSLMHVLVPLLAGEDEDRLRHDAWGFLLLIGGLFVLLAIILYVTATWWIPFTVPGFSEAGKVLTVELTRIQLIGMIFSAINGVQWATYHARQQFVWAEFTPILASTFSLLLLIWALPRFGVVAAAWISTMRIALQTLLLSPAMGRPVWPDLKSTSLQQAWARIKPLLLGTAFYKTESMVDSFLLSSASSGSLSLYYLAQQLYGAVSQVLNKAISAPLVPILGRLYKTGDMREFQKIYHRRLFALGVICIAGLLSFGFIGQWFLTFLIGHGNVTASNVGELWWVMICLGGMFAGGAMGQIVSSSFYSCGNTRSPILISLTTYTIYLPIKVMVYKYYAIQGIALLMSIYYLLDLLLLFSYKRIYLSKFLPRSLK